MAKANPSKLKNVLEAVDLCNLSDTKKTAIKTVINRYLDGELVPVIHCEDCRHLDMRGMFGYCGTGPMRCIVRAQDYCSHGERKKG